MANTFDPYNPQHWAYESLAILEETMIGGGLCYRDFEDTLGSYGQIVNTRKPAEFTAEPYEKGDTITNQDASATNVQVMLDQMLDVSFTVYDVEATYSFKNLVEEFLYPAILAHGRMLDRKIFGKASQFLSSRTGGLGTLTKTTAQDYLVDTEKRLTDQKAHEMGRNLVLSTSAKAELLKTDIFTSAERASNGGEAQRAANLGEKFGMQTWASLNVPSVRSATKTTATTTTSAQVAGDTTVVVASASNLAKGAYFTVAGDMTPLRVAALNTLTITTTRPLLNGIASSAAVQPYAVGAVDLVAGYAAGWTKWIHVDGTGVPQVGQLVSFQNASNVLHTDEYVIVAVKAVSSDYEIILDRPLVTALANDDIINYGPNGDLNFAFHRNAIMLVNRPLAMPPVSTGVRVAVARSKHMAMRVMLGYDQSVKALKVSVDSLFGIKAVETGLGCVMLG